MLSLAGLLIHSDDVPAAARIALSTALSAPAEERRSNLVQAARILHHDAGIACEDACELVGLADDYECDATCD